MRRCGRRRRWGRRRPFSCRLPPRRCAPWRGCRAFWLILFLAGKGGALRRACTDGRGWLLMAATVVFGPFVGVSLSLMATQYTSTGVAMTIMSLSPVLILWPAHVLFGQRVTRREVLGALISVAGVALFFV